MQLAEDAAIAAAEGRVNEATALWKGGQFGEAARVLAEAVEALQAMAPPREPLVALRKALLQACDDTPAP